MNTLTLIVLLWCLPAGAIIVFALLQAAGQAALARRWHLHEVFDGDRISP